MCLCHSLPLATCYSDIQHLPTHPALETTPQVLNPHGSQTLRNTLGQKVAVPPDLFILRLVFRIAFASFKEARSGRHLTKPERAGLLAVSRLPSTIFSSGRLFRVGIRGYSALDACGIYSKTHAKGGRAGLTSQ